MDEKLNILRGPFDPAVHKKNFINYLEVVLLPSGKVEYAVPSHIEKLKSIYRSTKGRDPDADCPRERWCDYLDWLQEQTHCVSLWYDRWSGSPNAKQRQRIVALAAQGLYKGRNAYSARVLG